MVKTMNRDAIIRKKPPLYPAAAAESERIGKEAVSV